MTARRALKLIHVVSTVWFVLCVGYILVLTLHQVGFNWLLIFSLSGHSVIVVFVLVSLYLFALFRGAGGSPHDEVEHPVTGTQYYMGFYVAAPLLGGLAGIIGMIGAENVGAFILGIVLGTLGTTFSVWVVIDPLIGLAEMLTPDSRRHRAERIARAEAERKVRQQKRERLLAEAFAREEQERERWHQTLQPQARRLAELLASDASGVGLAEREAVDIGAQAWRLGGLSCMRQLHDMALAAGKAANRGTEAVDYLAYWWDGIGDWRRPSLG